MPSLARMLGLMLVFAGPLGLAAQTFPPRGPSSGPSSGPPSGPSSVRPGVMPAARAYQPISSLPPTGPMRSNPYAGQPDPYAGRVVSASHQAPAGSFSREPMYAQGAPSVGVPSPENRSPETTEVGPLMRWDPGNPESIQEGPNKGFLLVNMPPGSMSPGSMSPSGVAIPVALSPRRKAPTVPLSPQGQSDRDGSGGPTGLTSLVTAGGSLALVLGIFFLVAWGMRRVRPASMMALPGEVFEVLGRAPMANRQQVHLLRCGSKLLLVCVTPTGTETLTEIVDPMEVDRLAGLCRQTHPGSATEAFRQVFKQFAPQQPDSGSLSRLFAGRDREDRSPDGLGMRMAPGELEDQNV